MGLLVYKFSDYDHTAEREQFRELCKSLKAYYGEKNESCIFIGNFNVNNIELDAFIIKPDAIINLEFKNYGGKIIATDNGEWMLTNGVIIKGGSGKSVYQQAFINRNQTQKGLKQIGHLTNKQVRNLAALVVFNQPIEAMDTSRLSPVTKSWLHIADNSTFIEKVQDITNPDLRFEHGDILSLLKSLYLDQRYLVEEYSNLEMLDENYSPTSIAVEFIPDPEEPKIEEKSKKEYTPQKKIKVVGRIDLDKIDSMPQQKDQLVESDSKPVDETIDDHQTNPASTQSSPSMDEDTQSEIDSLSVFIHNVFKQICKGKEFTIHAYRFNDPNLLATFPNMSPKRQWFLLVQIEGAQTLVEKVTKFMHREVQCTSDYLMFEVGLPIEDEQIHAVKDQMTSEVQDTTSIVVHEKLKSRTSLPSWLDRMLFEKLGAQYNPNYQRHSYNLDLTEEEVLNYLGTYFPRSYAEAFCIYDDLCNQSAFLDSFKSKSQIEILDLGCGTGGELVGLVSALEKHIPSEVPFHIEAIDGNNFSLEKFKEIMAYITKKSHRQYEVVAQQRVIRCTDDIESIAESYSDRKFDIIQMCKFGCELESHRICKMANPYQLLLTIFGKLLSNESVFLLLDVTTLSNTDNHFYPSLINMGVRDSLRRQPLLGTLVPTCCHLYGDDCPSPCFTQKEFYVRHSKKIGDLSKVAYRIVAPKKFIEKFGIAKEEFQYIIKSGAFSDENICRFSTPEAPFVDAYKLNAK